MLTTHSKNLRVQNMLTGRDTGMSSQFKMIKKIPQSLEYMLEAKLMKMTL